MLFKLSMETAIHAFITSHLDYCNSLYFGIYVLNGMLTGCSKCCGEIPEAKDIFFIMLAPF